MGIKDILVFIDDGDANEERAISAFQLAKKHGAHLTAACLGSMKPVHAKSSDSEAIERMAYKLSNQLVKDFTEEAAKVDLKVETIIISGDASVSAEKMANYARNADLVILSQPNPSRDNYSRIQDFVQEVILLSGRPILFMPYIGTDDILSKRTMIAWDGTPAASRAVHDAIPLMIDAEEVIILVVESKKQKEQKKNLQESRLKAHLGNHGINATIRKVNPGKNDVPTVILNQITDNGIDLLIVGGYGTPTLKQKIFGSVSSTLLSSMTVPVLMSH